MSLTNNPIVVLGAAGRTGRLIIDASMRAGRHTTALVRNADHADLARRDNLRVLVADATNAESLRDIFLPAHTIICAIGPSGRNSNGLYEDVARAVVGATLRTEPHRFIAITSSGVRRNDPNHPWWYRLFLVPVMRKTYNDMVAMEDVITASRLNWTFVRPGRLLDEPATGSYRVEDSANPKGGLAVSRCDVANFTVHCAADEIWSYRNPTITR